MDIQEEILAFCNRFNDWAEDDRENRSAIAVVRDKTAGNSYVMINGSGIEAGKCVMNLMDRNETIAKAVYLAVLMYGKRHFDQKFIDDAASASQVVKDMNLRQTPNGKFITSIFGMN
jgi:hypothetical protein